jgi:hypothetical protein
LALVPQIADAVGVPIIAAGGIADGRGIAAAFALGAAGVQIGTAYLFCPEAAISPLYRDALRQACADTTVVTDVFTGRPARALSNRLTREFGPFHGTTPDFPTPILALAPLRRKAEQQGSREFSAHWAGQAAPLGKRNAGRGANPHAGGGGIEAVSPARWLACPRAMTEVASCCSLTARCIDRRSYNGSQRLPPSLPSAMKADAAGRLQNPRILDERLL